MLLQDSLHNSCQVQMKDLTLDCVIIHLYMRSIDTRKMVHFKNYVKDNFHRIEKA